MTRVTDVWLTRGMTKYEWLLEQLEIETDECQIWPYYCKSNGYGQIRVGKLHSVHRLALQIVTGQDGEGLEAAHKPVVCHNPACFNPRHLDWKTPAENQADRRLDGTTNRGANGNSKLTEQQVLEIKARYESGNFTYQELAKMFDVSPMHISRIARGLRWSHLTPS